MTPERSLSLDETLSESIWIGNAVEALYCLTTGADVNKTDKHGYTPLTLATNDADMEEVVRQLLLRNADVNKKADDGTTALGQAVSRDDVALAEELIAHGALLNERGRGGFTPLIWCMHYGSVDCLKLLVAKGADLDATDEKGKTVLDWAENSAGPVREALQDIIDERRRAEEEKRRLAEAAAAAAVQTAQHRTAQSVQERLKQMKKSSWRPR